MDPGLSGSFSCHPEARGASLCGELSPHCVERHCSSRTAFEMSVLRGFSLGYVLSLGSGISSLKNILSQHRVYLFSSKEKNNYCYYDILLKGMFYIVFSFCEFSLRKLL